MPVSAGSLPYVAPEVLHDGEVAKRADVYSFAMLLLEMWSGKVAYADDNYHAVSACAGPSCG